MTYIVSNNGDIIDADNLEDMQSEYQGIDSVFPSREVAEIRSGIIKTERANRQPYNFFNSKDFVAEAMKILEDELGRSRKENLHKEGV